jgi:type IV pilus assembly protein PilV
MSGVMNIGRGGLAPRVKQSGISLIEVLVSIVIASIGLLALAGVNATSVRYTKLSQYRGTATLLATDIGERIRANKGGIAAYILAPAEASFAAQSALPAAPVPLCDAVADTCTANQLAAADMYAWRILVRNQLPEGSVAITHNAAQLASDVWVVWRDPAVANDDELALLVNECPANLSVAGDRSVRCSYFRINS